MLKQQRFQSLLETGEWWQCSDIRRQNRSNFAEETGNMLYDYNCLWSCCQFAKMAEASNDQYTSLPIHCAANQLPW